jgi:subtilase family serine protease
MPVNFNPRSNPMKSWLSLKPWLVLTGAALVGNSAFAQSADEPAVYARPVCAQAVEPGYARCHAWVVTDAQGNDKIDDGPTGLHPADLRDAYKITGQGDSSITVAIVDAFHYVNAEADLAVYRSTFGLPPCTTDNGCFKQVAQNGGTNFGGSNSGWNFEEALDLDMVSAMCPNCKILVVEGHTNTFHDLARAVSTAARLGAHVISNSYGGGEGGSHRYESLYDHPGVAVTASSGDSGFGVQFPASSPHVIAVGGTYLHTDGSQRGWAETAWSGAGSGCSTKWKKPGWQKDPLCSKRMEADVSAVASPASAVSVYFGSWRTTGGTSVAAPLIGGIYGEKGGFVHYAGSLYKHTGDLFDITSGSNGSCGGTYLCTAGPGYDGPTGLGTPNGDAAF